MREKLRDVPVYTASILLFRFYLKLWHRLKVAGLEHIPREGGVLLASNHNSFLDPPAIGGSCLVRPIRFMARDSLWNSRFGKWWMTQVNCIPVARGTGDMKALKAVIRTLQEGGCCSVFPEGTRSEDGSLQEGKGGVGFMVLKAGVPVVPVCVSGTHEAWPKHARFPRPCQVTVTYGPPIAPEEFAALGTGRAAYEKAAALIMARIADLKPKMGNSAKLR